MRRINSYKATVFFVLLLTAGYACAQPKTTVKIIADRNRILVGETIQLTLEADIPENEPIRFFIIDTIPHFEITGKQKTDTTNTDEGTFLKQVIRITSFDSGHWVIPPFALGDDITTDSIPVDVVFSEGFNPDQAYHDIKDIIEVHPEEKKKKWWWWWYAIAGGALLIALLLVYLFRKKKPAEVTAAPPVDPYEEAMKQLEGLQNEKTDHKLYYSSLVDIFRVYVNKKKGIHSMQKTTDDLVVQLRGIAIPKEHFEKLSQALRLSDFVKFARYVPAKEDDRNSWEAIKRAINEIEQLQ